MEITNIKKKKRKTVGEPLRKSNMKQVTKSKNSKQGVKLIRT
jgi:hypothetical protein